MKLQPYPSYKDSEIGWLGNVPTEWELRRIKFTIVEKKNVENTELQSGAISFGEVITKDDESILPETRQSYQEVLVGEFLINPINLNYDLKSLRTALSRIDVCVSPAYIVAKLSDETVDRIYLKYLLHQFDLAHMKTLGAGVRQTIKFSDIGNCFWCLPSSIEQSQIANFLNHEITKLHNLIAKQEHLIELLQEKRHAIISHAVTKGLNPDAQMKDSGVEWLGMVPEHWEVTKIKYVANLNPKVPEWVRGQPDLLCNFLPMEKIGDDGTCILDTEKEVVDVISGYTFFENGDVCYAKVTPCFENGKGIVFSGLKNGIGFGTTEITVFRPTELILSELLYFIFQSSYFKSIGESSMTGAGGLKRVSDGVADNLVIAIPNIPEQLKLIERLKSMIKTVDDLTAKAQRSIELAKEHQTALISGAVTGKIDVRDYVNDLDAA